MSNYRDAYYPGTEELAPDEMRVIALGTGMPSLRPSQMSDWWEAGRLSWPGVDEFE